MRSVLPGVINLLLLLNLVFNQITFGAICGGAGPWSTNQQLSMIGAARVILLCRGAFYWARGAHLTAVRAGGRGGVALPDH